MHWILLCFITLLLSLTPSSFADITNNGIPNCTVPSGNAVNLNPVAAQDQLRFAVIAHYSILSTFFHSPEQAARDAAAIVNVDIEWQRHVINTGETMAEDIRDAVDRVCKLGFSKKKKKIKTDKGFGYDRMSMR